MKPCSVVTCNTDSYCRGYCNKHYRRFMTTGDPEKMLPKGQAPRGRKCSYERCDRNHLAKGLCTVHYTRAAQGKELDTPMQEICKGKTCPCGAPAKVKLMCGTCYDNSPLRVERRREVMSKHYEENRGYYKAKKQKRDYREKQCTPSWLTEEQKAEINSFYYNRQRGYEVDHIVPLNGEQVTGLHVPWNLQYLTQADNRSKGNKL